LALAACATVIEQLEQRSLLSAVVGSDGTLTVTGTSGADVIHVGFNLDFTPGSSGGEVYVLDNQTEYGFSAAAVKRVVINGGDGNDDIDVNGTETDEDPKASALSFAITDGNGTDSVSSYIGDTGFVQGYHVPAPTESITVGDGNDTVFDSGGTDATIVAGNGNDSITAAGNNDPLTITLTAGNGNDSVFGASPGAASLTINATMGTGHDTYNNLDDPDIFINAHTTDGQISGTVRDDAIITGRAFVGSPANGQAGVTVYLDANNNGVFDAGDPSTTTNANGDYTLEAPVPDPFAYAVAVNTTAFTTPTTMIREHLVNGLGYSGDDFALVPLGTATNPRLIGTAGSYQNQGNTIANAVDKNVSTFFDAPVATGAYVGFDYGSPQVIKQISFAPRIKFAARMVGGLFQGSNSADFSNAVTLYQVTTAPVVGQLTTVNISPAKGAFRYVRYLGPADSYCNIAELEFDG
jgi:hypothetical protein